MKVVNKICRWLLLIGLMMIFVYEIPALNALLRGIIIWIRNITGFGSLFSGITTNGLIFNLSATNLLR